MSMSPTYRADHVGSFLRPADLLQARKFGAPSDQLRTLEDKHIARVLEKQWELGLSIFTDGEFRRSNFMSDFTDAVEGFDLGEAVTRHWDQDKAQRAQTATAVSSVTGKSRRSLSSANRLPEVSFLFFSKGLQVQSR